MRYEQMSNFFVDGGTETDRQTDRQTEVWKSENATICRAAAAAGRVKHECQARSQGGSLGSADQPPEEMDRLGFGAECPMQGSLFLQW